MPPFEEYTRDRIRMAVGRFAGKVYPDTRPLEGLRVAGPTDRIPLSEAQGLTFEPARLGMELGPLWATYWFNDTVTVPEEWAGQRVDLLWTTKSEGTLWIDGKSVQGLNDSTRQPRTQAKLTDSAAAGQQFDLWIETACNTVFGEGNGEGEVIIDTRSQFYLREAAIGVYDPLAFEIFHDLRVLSELEEQHIDPHAKLSFGARGTGASVGDMDKAWAGKLLAGMNDFANTVDEDDRSTWPEAQKILKELLAQTNGSFAHEITAVGHAHIDTTWRWPLAETHRKCVRTFTSQTR